MRNDPTATRLAGLVADRDREQLGKHVTDDVRLRALLPTGPLEVHGREAALDAFDGWFGDHGIVLEDAQGELVGDRLLVHYRLGFRFVEGPHVMTQTWVASVGADGLLFRVDLLCSGFRKVTT